MDIVACASDNYTMPCGIMMYSACANNPYGTLQFHIFVDCKFTEKHKNQLRHVAASFGDDVSFYIITEEMVRSFMGFESQLYPIHIFYRLLMGEILAMSIKKVLYLDCDIIVRHSLEDLFGMDMSNHSVGCVHDALVAPSTGINRLGYPAELGYFNSGVLLANLEYWREHQVVASFKNFIKNNSDKIILPDQDVLNYVFQSDKVMIPTTYNAQPAYYYKKDLMPYYPERLRHEIDDARSNPVILHMAGERPWIEGSTFIFKSEFFKYKKETIWGNIPLAKNSIPWRKRLFMSNIIRRPLSLLGICHVLPDPYDRELVLEK